MGPLRASQQVTKVFSNTIGYVRTAYRVEKHFGEMPMNVLKPLMQQWAQASLASIGVSVEVVGSVKPSDRPVIFVGNHISYLDIPVLIATTPIFFVSKSELARWPVLGHAAKLVGTVFVERDNSDSRALVGRAIASCIQERKESICIFPSGTTTLDESASWRHGAFRIAKRFNIPVQPFRLTYDPLRLAAYIDDDALVTHMVKLVAKGGSKALVEFHEPIEIKDPAADCERIQAWSQPHLVTTVGESSRIAMI